MNGLQLRLNKLFSQNQPAVVIAIDHGYMDGPIPGMENLPDTIQKIDPCVDAILLSPGMLKQLRGAFDYKGAPIPIVRLNWSTVFCFGCPIPILGLGGHATPDPVESLELARAILADGARGVVFGRNAIQRPDPKAYQLALCDVVKRGVTPAQAAMSHHL